ncbi:MAG: 30S ribosomal protein S4 [Acidilobaceae archaeon]|nr:30S ribosomal protein S4 [Acidilobaceae archaeon]MDW7974229.1 30S ribosomal protein S4 [Sulfolobales archaeon]
MGDPKKSSRTWQGPKHPWIKERLVKEIELIGRYGLKNKRELWKAETLARNFRHKARATLGLPAGAREAALKAIFDKLKELGLVSGEVSLDAVLGLTAEQILERRLQTIVFKKGLARSVHEARQFITHGHIAIGGRRVTSPGYLVSLKEEPLVSYAPGSPLLQRAAQEGGESVSGA